MLLNRTTPVSKFEIWAPRWHDRTVLLSKMKVGMHNEIVFTKSPNLPGSYYVNGGVVKQCQTASNGSVTCYIVPLDKLERLERR